MNNFIKYKIMFIVIMTIVACGSNNTEQNNTENVGAYGIRPADSIRPAHAIRPEEPETSKESNIKVDAITSATRHDNRTIFNGIVVIPSQRHATITLFMDGTVKSTSLLSGMFVRRGELLAVFENPEYITLQQSYIESLAQEEFLETEYNRQKLLFNNEAVSKKTYQQSKVEYLSMRSRREAAAAQLKLLGFDTKKIIANGIIPQLELRSPIEGYIANVQANIGKYIAAGETVCEIIDKRAALLKLTVYERDINKIKNGDKIEFRVNSMGTQTFHATVISLGQTVDNISRSLEVYAKIDSDDTLFRPGMYVSAQVVSL